MNRSSPFHVRKFWQVSVEPILPRGLTNRTWFSRDRAEKRTFEIYYGYNPRCSHKGTWGKPGFGPWRNRLAYYRQDA